nr:hypothetical protein OG461_05035 [Streptomyces sp. NBC_00995]
MKTQGGQISDRILVAVEAGRDPISHTGLVGQLTKCPSLKVAKFDCEPDTPAPQVALVVAPAIDEQHLRVLRRIQRTTSAQSILVVASITEQALIRALAAGAVGVILREQATPDHLESVINVVAHQGGHLPPPHSSAPSCPRSAGWRPMPRGEVWHSQGCRNEK